MTKYVVAETKEQAEELVRAGSGSAHLTRAAAEYELSGRKPFVDCEPGDPQSLQIFEVRTASH